MYSRSDVRINGKHHWVQENKYAENCNLGHIWYDTIDHCWSIGSRRDLGTQNCDVHSNTNLYYDYSWPHEIEDWVYTKDGDWVVDHEHVDIIIKGN